MLWREEMDVPLISYSTGHIDVWIEQGLVDGGCFFTGFYGHWSVSQRKHSWELLQRIGSHRRLPWCILGDFNEILYDCESDSSRPRPTAQMKAFRQAIENLELMEIEMENTLYTWRNRRQGDDSVRAKLDHCFGNRAFHTVFPHVSVVTLPAYTSDHHLLKLLLEP